MTCWILDQALPKSEEREFPGGPVVKNRPLLPMQGTQVQSLVQEDATGRREN